MFLLVPIRKNITNTPPFLLIGVFVLFLESKFTYLTIANGRYLKSRVLLAFGFSADIIEIKKIERGSIFRFKGWGSRLEIHHIKNGNNYIDEVWETRYSVSTIKELITDIKKINPSIKLHPQYQDLIDGKIEDEDSFKRIPIKISKEKI